MNSNEFPIKRRLWDATGLKHCDYIREDHACMEWNSNMDDAPEYEFCLYAANFTHTVTGNSHWEYFPLSLDEDGQLRDMAWDYFDVCSYEDFSYWMPLPHEPKEGE